MGVGEISPLEVAAPCRILRIVDPCVRGPNTRKNRGEWRI